MVTSGEFGGNKLRLKNDDTNLQQIKSVTYYCIQALHDYAPTDNCDMAVKKNRIRLNALPMLGYVWGSGHINSIPFCCLNSAHTNQRLHQIHYRYYHLMLFN